MADEASARKESHLKDQPVEKAHHELDELIVEKAHPELDELIDPGKMDVYENFIKLGGGGVG